MNQNDMPNKIFAYRHGGDQHWSDHTGTSKSTSYIKSDLYDSLEKSILDLSHPNMKLLLDERDQLKRELNGFCAELGFTDFQSPGNAVLAMIEFLELKRRITGLQAEMMELRKKLDGGLVKCDVCDGKGWYAVSVPSGIGAEQEQCMNCLGTGQIEPYPKNKP